MVRAIKQLYDDADDDAVISLSQTLYDCGHYKALLCAV